MSYGGGSGGSSSIATGSDVALSNPANGQALLYNSSSQKWINGAVAGGAIVTRTATGATTLLTSDQVIFADATSAGFTITLPTAVGFTGRYTIDDIDSSTNVVTIVTSPNTQTIDGAANVTVGTQASGATYKSVDLISDGSNWRVV